MITAFYAGILSFLLLTLLLRVVIRRWRYRVSLGDGGNADLKQSIRAHGNFVETVPWLLLLMLLMDISGVPALAMHIYGVALVVARVLHAWGIISFSGPNFGRIAGMTLTILLFAAGGATCLWIGLN